ncbi:MAG: RICIN domain-containing protein [Deltaproteobacteria bacterium]|nr:RICIN domain-containing protein [Deltaproteobacteria bacterium]
MRAHLSTLFVPTCLLFASCAAPTAEDDVREAEGITPGVFYVLEAKHSGKVLDVAGASTADGANVQQWSRNGSAAQQWRFDPVGDGWYVIRARVSDKALDVKDRATFEGANVQQWGYVGGAHQQWRLEDAGGGYHYLRARHSGMYLDVAWAGKNDGANVAQVKFYGSDAQKWKLGPATTVSGSAIAAGDYELRMLHSGKCLDVPGSSGADGTKLQQWTCNGSDAQRFRVSPVTDGGGGAWRIVNVASGKALDITDVSVAPGARLQQWGWGGGANQRFAIEPNGDGTHRIRARHSGLVLDVWSGSTADGAPIVQWPAHDGGNQRFRFVPAKTTGGPGGPTDPGPTTPSGWKLAWSDEFDGAGLPDASKWSYDVGGHGWGNGEAQFYTDKRLENARLEGGRLIIEARRESYGGKAYTSARLVSRGRGDWLYGRFEIRAKLPGGRGTWPAIWMLPTDWKYGGWPNSGEIDIMEHVGFDPGRIHGTVHTQAYNHTIGTQKGTSLPVADATSAFHVYAAEWSPERIEIFVDGTKYFSFANEHTGSATWPFDQRFHLILNIAVGGSWGGVKGIDDGAFPQRMEIDWARVYQR